MNNKFLSVIKNISKILPDLWKQFRMIRHIVQDFRQYLWISTFKWMLILVPNLNAKMIAFWSWLTAEYPLQVSSAGIMSQFTVICRFTWDHAIFKSRFLQHNNNNVANRKIAENLSEACFWMFSFCGCTDMQDVLPCKCIRVENFRMFSRETVDWR